MKMKKILLVALATILMGSTVACSNQGEKKPEQGTKKEMKDEKKGEMKDEKKEMPKASEEEKAEAIKNLEEQKKLELEIPGISDKEKSVIETKYATIIDKIKKDEASKEEVMGLSSSAKNYIENVKKAKGEK